MGLLVSSDERIFIAVNSKSNDYLPNTMSSCLSVKKDLSFLSVELRRRGTIFEDPCPKSEGFIGKLIDIFSKKK